MPRRSTTRQRVVFHIERQLASEACVEESAFLIDRLTNQPREVDVVVKAKVGQHQLQVCIECHDQARKATVEWIEQMFAKHSALPTSKLILVSNCGFTASANRKAALLGLELMSLQEAEAENWAETFGNSLLFDMFAIRIVGCFLVLADRPGQALSVNRKVEIFNDDGTPRGLIGEFVDQATSGSDRFTEQALQTAASDALPTTLLSELRFKPSFFIKRRADSLSQVECVVLAIEIHEVTLSGPLRTARYRSASIGYTQGTTPVGDFVMTFVKPDASQLTGALSVEDARSGGVRTVSVRHADAPSGELIFVSELLRVDRGEA